MRKTMAIVVLALVFMAPAVPAANGSGKSDAVSPSQVPMAVYVPPTMMKLRAYLNTSGIWIEPGKALSDALQDVGGQYFPTMTVIPSAGDKPYGVLLDLAPDWKPEYGKLRLTIKYDAYDAAGAKTTSGSAEQNVPIKAGNFNQSAFTASRLAINQIMQDVYRHVQADTAKFPANGRSAAVDARKLVNHEKPEWTGTGFFINKSGQLLTAAHVSRDCMLLEANQGNDAFPVTVRVSSDLLDVAVLDSGKARPTALPMRRGQQIVLGESVTSVGYPLRGILGDSVNVTRGNISASRGLKGSWGMFQFSAPTQPGNSGGPVVSDQGEMLGMTVTTLNAASMAERGIIPQNINFALDARYVAMFLGKEHVAFDTIEAKGVGDMQAANQAALANTVQLSCYE